MFVFHIIGKVKRRRQFNIFRKTLKRKLTEPEIFIGKFFIQNQRWGTQRFFKIIGNYEKYKGRYFDISYAEAIGKLKSWFPQQYDLNAAKLIYLLKEKKYLSIVDGKVFLKDNLEVFIKELALYLEVHYPQEYKNRWNQLFNQY